MRYRWLHISDLHSICSGIRTAIMRDALIDEIKYLNEQSKFSFLLITGDISNKNQGYEEAKILINRVIDAMGLQSEKVFIVPGNHDVDRRIPPDRQQIVQEGWELALLDNQEDQLLKALLPGQSDFFCAYEDILGRKYPIGQIHFSHDVDENVSIIHLNTSWMCYDSENESGKLHLGLQNVYKCLHDKNLRSKAIKIAIGHHRISDFNKVVEGYLKSLFKTTDVDLYLGGHCHTSTVLYDPTINTEFCSCRQARAEDDGYPAGFIVGDIDTETDQSNFQFYNWDSDWARWTYDYTVNPAKHGKYYLRGEKFTKESEVNRNIIVDLKLFGVPLNYDSVMDTFKLYNAAIYKSSIRDIRPKSNKEWKSCLKDLKNIYEEIIKDSNNNIHIFPIASIPLLVAFGYFIQNDNPNIKIYQYYENECKWVLDELDETIKISSNIEINGSKKLAVTLNVSGTVGIMDVEAIMGKDYDLLSVGVDNPRLSLLNYQADVLRAKIVIKSEMDSLYDKYDEIHLFLAAPAGLCIEVGRIIRENMYPDTYIYNFERSSEPKYLKVFNLKQIRHIR
ncbi:SAVED domain-containing protein [Anaerospora hongkongensis]|uniref:SAVED domain-containing protein n=1 Tax=Anaerospora hongkongensis TaxID=244830 RepID=UPI0028A05EF5|nr:SAVED domain-containing protein [Anaerospora hongkongensis]